MDKCMNRETDKISDTKHSEHALRCVRQNLEEGIGVFSPLLRMVPTNSKIFCPGL